MRSLRSVSGAAHSGAALLADNRFADLLMRFRQVPGVCKHGEIGHPGRCENVGNVVSVRDQSEFLRL
jgi:hypothetical protein